MKITIVQGAFLPVPPLQGGAVEKIWFSLGREFARSGHTVYHYSRSFQGLPEEEIIDGVHHRRISGFPASRSLVILKFFDFLYSIQIKKILPPADIVITHTFWLPILLRDFSRGRMYVHVQRYPKGQMLLYRRASRIQTVSSVIRDAILKQCPRLASKVKIINNPIPHDLTPQKVPAPRAREPVIILYVGRLHPQKGLSLLLEAFSNLSNRHPVNAVLRIVGPHLETQGGAGENYLRKLKRSLPDECRKRVEWIGPIFDSAVLRRHYEESSFLVYPSLAAKGEASPLTPVEAMANGCIPILSDLKCFKEYLRPGQNGFYFSLEKGKTVENLTEALSQACQSTNNLPQMRQACLETAQRFLPENIAREYLSDFQSLLRP